MDRRLEDLGFTEENGIVGCCTIPCFQGKMPDQSEPSVLCVITHEMCDKSPVEQMSEIEKMTDNLLYTERVSIELSNLCNYSHFHKKCPLSLKSDSVILSREIVEGILEYLGKNDFGGIIAFHTYNEPLIDPRLFLFIKYAKEKCPASTVMVLSNGFYFNQTLADELVEVGVGLIYITTYTEEEGTRLSTIKLNIPYAVLPRTLDDRLNLYNMKIPEKENKTPCHAPLKEIIIACDGRISLCCLDWKRRHCFGNLHNESLEDIISKSDMLNVYLSLSKGDRIFDICKVCGLSR